MANALYDAYREAALRALLDGEDVIVLLVDGSIYSRNLTTDDFMSDITGGSIIATSDPLTGMTFAAGVLDADDVLLPAVPAGQQGDMLVIVIDTGTPSTSRVVANYDTGTNFPITPNGGDINIAWSSAPSRMYKL